MLTEHQVHATRPDPTRVVRLADTAGLHVLVQPRGSKWWRWNYRFAGRKKTISFGTYPIVTLSRAREKQLDAQRLLDRGLDPSAERQRERRSWAITFEVVAKAWFDQRARIRAPRTIRKLRAIYAMYLRRAIGTVPISRLTPLDVLAPLRRIEDRGYVDTAHTARTLVSMIYRYAVATGRADRDVTRDIRKALTPIKARHYAALTDPAEIGRLLRAIDGYHGSPIVRDGLWLLARVFVRSGELRSAEWHEIDLAGAIWRIPAERMKMGRAHVVPLARQVVARLQALHALTGGGRFVFPHRQDPTRPMGITGLWQALGRLGYAGTQTPHGFRTIAATRLRELGWKGEVIEIQLAHGDPNSVRAAYNRAGHVEQRRAMMQAYADHLEALAVHAR